MLSQVAEVLAADEVGAVPVLASGSLVGLVSERDVVSHVAVGADLSHLTAGEVMSTESSPRSKRTRSCGCPPDV